MIHLRPSSMAVLRGVILTLGLGACEGQLDGPTHITSCVTPAPGRAPMRRLTPFEIDRTLGSLFDAPTDVATRALPSERVGGYTTSVDVGAVTSPLVEAYQAMAEEVSSTVVADMPGLLGCDVRAGEDACIGSFLDRFGRRAYRRPLETLERARLLAFYQATRTTETTEESVQRLLEVMLQSPRFLYRIELPAEGAAAGVVRPLDDYEIASRLSFLVWAETPDDALLDDAEAGMLTTEAGRTAALDRLLRDPRAAEVVSRFVDEWLELERLESMTKSDVAYPSYDDSLAPLFREETVRFVRAAWEEDGASIETLISADWSIRNGTLNAFYGEGGASGDAWARTPLPEHRRGILGHASFLAAYAKPADTSPTRRGMFVRGRLLCGVVDSPPPDVVTEVPDPDPTLTLRERLSAHRENPHCASCHVLMDPIGLGFEAFDGVGLHRVEERGNPIDATGDVVLSDVSGPFDGAIELTERLAASDDVRRCMTRQYFRFAMGRTDDASQATECTLREMRAAMREGTGSLRDLLVGLVSSPGFTHIAVPAPVSTTGGSP